MKIDPAQVLARFIATENPNIQYTPVDQNRERGIGKRVIDALCAELNASIERALYSIDPTALERLGTLIAEHALGKLEIVPCALPPGHEGNCGSGHLAPGAPRCDKTRAEDWSNVNPFRVGGTCTFSNFEGKRSTFEVTTGERGNDVHLELRRMEVGEPVRQREYRDTRTLAEAIATRELDRELTGFDDPDVVRYRVTPTMRTVRWRTRERVPYHAPSARLNVYRYDRGWADVTASELRVDLSSMPDGSTVGNYSCVVPSPIDDALGGGEPARPLVLRFTMDGTTPVTFSVSETST